MFSTALPVAILLFPHLTPYVQVSLHTAFHQASLLLSSEAIEIASSLQYVLKVFSFFKFLFVLNKVNVFVNYCFRCGMD